jgi:hypothetical protein
MYRPIRVSGKVFKIELVESLARILNYEWLYLKISHKYFE